MAGKKISRKGAKYKKSYKSPSWYRPKGYKQGEKSNNNYKSGVSTYRKRALKRDGKKCTSCGKTKPASQLEVNHRDTQGKRRYSNNHSNKNIHTLCLSCHRKSFQGRGKKKTSKKGKKK